MKLVYHYRSIHDNNLFLNHIKSLVVDEDDNGEFRLERVRVDRGKMTHGGR